MLDLLRRNFYFAVLTSSRETEVYYKDSPEDRACWVHQRNGFKVKFFYEEIKRWVPWRQ